MLFHLGVGLNDFLLFLRFGGWNRVRNAGCLFPFGTCNLSLHLGEVSGAFRFGLLRFFGHGTALVRLRLLLAQFRVARGFYLKRDVLALHRLGVRSGNTDALFFRCVSPTNLPLFDRLGKTNLLFLVGLSDADLPLSGCLSNADFSLCNRLRKANFLFLVGLGDTDLPLLVRAGNSDFLLLLGLSDTDLARAFLLRHIDARLVDGLACGLLAECLDVAGFVVDVLDVDVDDAQADLRELDLDGLHDRALEFLAILVDLLDVHRRDRRAELTEDDVLRDLPHGGLVELQQALRGVLHDCGLRADADCEGRRGRDPDVLLRERALQRNLDRDRRQIKV